MKRTNCLFLCGVLICFTAEFASAQKTTPVYKGLLRYTTLERLDSVKKEFSEMLNYVACCNPENINLRFMGMPYNLPKEKGVVVTPDSVIFNLSKKVKYAFLYSNKQEILINEYVFLGKAYTLHLPNLEICWQTKNLEYAKKLADDLVYFQHLKEFQNRQVEKQFESLASQYRALAVKPEISENERRYIVQANAMTQSKDYNRAIDLYEKAIALNPTNPMLYNNEALLFAMIGQFGSAINRMKKYLLLVPDAPDARAAQDKIYEWEAETEKK